MNVQNKNLNLGRKIRMRDSLLTDDYTMLSKMQGKFHGVSCHARGQLMAGGDSNVRCTVRKVNGTC